MHDLIHDRFAIGAALGASTVPDFDASAVRRLMEAKPRRQRSLSIVARLAIASAVLLLVLGTFVEKTPALMARVESGCLRALHAMGVGAGLPPVPADIAAASRPVRTSLAAARRLANFAVVAPSGVPRDVTGSATFVAPLRSWSRKSRAWNTHGEEITFRYRRSGERTFDVLADAYDPSGSSAPRYVYDADAGGVPGATVLSVRHENFVWRSGDEVVSIVASSAIDAAEIERIRIAMNGIALPRIDFARTHVRPDRAEMHVIPAPGGRR